MNSASRLRTVITTVGFLLIAAFFLTTEHRAHLFGILPLLLLLACPLLHLFMHGGHGSHGAPPPGRGAPADDSHAAHRATAEDIR